MIGNKFQVTQGFQPIHDYILVKPLPRTISKIIHLDPAERPNYGIVKAIGPGKYNKKGKRIPLVVEPGQKIRFGEFYFPEIYQDGEKLLILQEADIAGVEDAPQEIY